MDLSWPLGISGKSGIDKDMFLDSHILLNYPSLDNIIKKVIQLSPGSLIYKVDISRAFRQLKVPGLGFTWSQVKRLLYRPIGRIWVQTGIFFFAIL